MTPAQAPEVRVAVLGPLAVTGTASPLQPRQVELVAALALAGPAGLPGEALREMLGAPGRPVPAASLRQLASRTRRRLGTPSAGGSCITCRGGTYALASSVTVDWDQFRDLAARGRAAGGREELRAALRLLRGEPLAGVYYRWLDPFTAEEMRCAVTDAATVLASLELAAGNPAAARRAARTGLRARPEAEQLWRLVMRAEDADGNTVGVYAAWRGCLAAVAAVAPGAGPHPDTAALFRELLSRPAARSAGSGR